MQAVAAITETASAYVAPICAWRLAQKASLVLGRRWVGPQPRQGGDDWSPTTRLRRA